MIILVKEKKKKMSTIESKIKPNLDYFLEIRKNYIFRKVTK